MNSCAASRNKAMRLIAIGVISLLFPTLVAAQDYVFGPNVRVNDDAPGVHGHSMLTRSGQHCIAARGDTVYLAWADMRSGDYNHAYFARSTNGGQSFGANIRLDHAIETGPPSFAVDDNGAIHVCWENRTDSGYIFPFYAKSTDGGRTFSTPIGASDGSRIGACPSIAVGQSGTRVYVAWWSTNGVIWLSRSTDGGATFLTPDVQVEHDSGVMHDASSAVLQDTIVLVAWDNNVRTYCARSLDGGTTFGPSVTLSDTQGEPSIAVGDSGNVYLLCAGPGGGAGLSVSMDTGRTFQHWRAVPNSPWAGDPSLAARPARRLFLAWDFYNDASSVFDVRFAFSSDGGTTFPAIADPSDGPWRANELDATVTANEQGTVFIAWEDTRNDSTGWNDDIYFAAGALTGVEEAKGPARVEIACKVTPNPTTGRLRVEYSTAKPGLNRVEVVDCLGRRVATLAETVRPAGKQSFTWSGHGDANCAVPSGVYFLRVTTPDGEATMKLHVVRD